MKKGLDSGSSGAIAQGDIKQYYDHVDPVRCGAWLLERGCCPELVGAAVRHQLMPRVEVAIASSRAEVGDRARGALTGSRVAGALGRVAVRDVMLWVFGSSSHRAFGPPEASVLMCSYVDNILVAGRDAFSARAVLSRVEERLRTRWSLALPESSVEVLAPRGAPSDVGEPASVEHTKFLGHCVSSDGRVTHCWGRAQGAVRAALWRHIHIRAARRARLSVAARLRLIDQYVWPIIAYRAPAWPPTESLYKNVDALQRWCTAQAMTMVRFPREELPQYFRRRSRLAGFEAKKAGMWSTRAADLVLRFRGQLRTESPAASWPARLLRWRGSDWVRERRIQCGSESVFPCGARLPGGRTAPRWDEACEMWQRIRGRSVISRVVAWSFVAFSAFFLRPQRVFTCHVAIFSRL